MYQAIVLCWPRMTMLAVYDNVGSAFSKKHNTRGHTFYAQDYRIEGNFRMVDSIFCIVEHHTKIKTTKISLHNNYVLRHYAELYDYLT